MQQQSIRSKKFQVKFNANLSNSIFFSVDLDYLDQELVYYGNSSYYFGLLSQPWASADRICKEMGSYLVRIDSYKEDVFLTKHLLQIQKAYRKLKLSTLL